MTALVLGLLLFLGIHSTRVFADGWRTRVIAERGEKPYKGLYTVVSLVGFALLVWGYGAARHAPVVLWPAPPVALRHVAALLTLVAFVFIAAAYVPRNAIKARLHHPMVLGVKAWALGHLLANNTLADLLLFGGFLLWAVLSFSAARRRDRAQGTVYPAGTAGGTITTVVVGFIAWAVFAFWLHRVLMGVQPLGAGA
jgi:uncharacterized membrane protein